MAEKSNEAAIEARVVGCRQIPARCTSDLPLPAASIATDSAELGFRHDVLDQFFPADMGKPGR